MHEAEIPACRGLQQLLCKIDKPFLADLREYLARNGFCSYHLKNSILEIL